MVEFGASIKLDSTSAQQQMRKFADTTTSASKALKKFQAETKATTQGGASNVFRGFINSSQRANQKILKTITLLQDERKAFSKLSDKQKEAVVTADKLNRKYDEAAAIERKLINTRKELRIVVASGLKTQKEADAIFDRQAEKLNRNTKAYKENERARKKLIATQKKETKAIDSARSKYDKAYIAKKRIAKVTKDLNLVLKAGGINQKEYNRILAKTTLEANRASKAAVKLTSRYGLLAKGARLVSIASRLLLGAYVAVRAVKMWVDFERTAEAAQLLDAKLSFLTGQSGGYQTLFEMTQNVGIALKDASKIITRFAVVTDRAFSTETMADWSSTLIQSARATGTSTQEMTGALIQITQAMSAGRLMGDEYRSVTENLPLLTVALRKTFKESTSSLKELSSQGLITNDIMIDAFEELKVMLEGFPDATKTIEASIGRLSSAWDNFIANASDSTFLKDFNNGLSNILNRMTNASKLSDITEKSNKIYNARDNLIADTKRLESVRNQIIAERELFNQRSGWYKSIVGFFGADGDNNALKIDERSFTNRIKKNKKILDDNLSEYKKELNASIATKESKEQSAKDAIFKRQLKTDKLADTIRGSSSLDSIKAKYDKSRNLLESSVNETEGGKLGGTRVEDYFGLLDEINEKQKQAERKLLKTNVDAQLRLKGFSTKNNIEKIQAELETSGRLLSIRKKFEKNIKTVNSAEEARKIAGKTLKGSELDEISKTTPAIAKELRESLTFKRDEDISVYLNNVSNSIEAVGISGEATIAKLNGDITASLGLEKKSVVADYDKAVIELDKRLKSMASTQENAGKTSEELTAIRIKELDVLDRLRIAQTDDIDRQFTSSLEDRFDSAAAATRKYNKDLIALNAAKIKLNLTDKQYNRELRILKENTRDIINLNRSLTGELSEFDQVVEGMNKGLSDFSKQSKTTFETVAESSTRFMDGLVDSIVEGGEKGKASFKSMVKSILADMQKLILKSIFIKNLGIGDVTSGGGGGGILQSILGSFGIGGGSTGGVGGGAFSASPDDFFSSGFNLFAKGGSVSGAGISSFSNQIVDKPTIFPFAKGTGLMGEAGAEAIMPLTRLSNGNLGVGSSQGGGVSSSITNDITINVDIDQTGKTEESSDSSSEDGKSLADALSGVVQQQLLVEIRPGGLLSSLAK